MPNNYPYQSGILPLRERIAITAINQSPQLIERLKSKHKNHQEYPSEIEKVRTNKEWNMPNNPNENSSKYFDKEEFDQAYDDFLSKGLPEYIAYQGAEAKAKKRPTGLDEVYLKEAEQWTERHAEYVDAFTNNGIEDELASEAAAILNQDHYPGLDARTIEQQETMRKLSRKLNELF